MSVQLYPHNQETYERMTEMFKTENRVGIVQPTGTGKSFLFLKWLEDHKEGRSIVLAPEMAIFDQLTGYARETNDESILEKAQLITYQTLIRMTPEEIDMTHAERIIIDEFHRTGARMWGPALQRLLAANDGAKVLGATATPIRYLDGHKNMADELFENKLARYMTLGEAVAKGILPEPIYIPVWYDYDEKLKQYQEDIAVIRDPKERAKLEEKLHELKNNLQNSYGAADVFKNHMPNDHGKYIVFCRDFEHLQEMQKTMKVWLSDINPNIRPYVSISREKDKDVQLDMFRADDGEDAIRLLFTIDRLNEGVHVKDIDGVIMLRPTVSPGIYLQQMGRALAAGSKSPIIFDMVNNYKNVEIIDEDGRLVNVFERDVRRGRGGASGEQEASTEQFQIFAQMAEFSKLFDHLENSLYLDREELWQKNYELFKEYIRINSGLPATTRTTIYKGLNLGGWLTHQKQLFKTGKLFPDREALLRSAGVDFETSRLDKEEAQWQQKYELFKEYITNQGYVPSQSPDIVHKGVKIGRWLFTQKTRHKAGKLSPEREALLRSVGVDFETSRLDKEEAQWVQAYELFKEYISFIGRLPTQRTVYKNTNIGHWLDRQKQVFKSGKLSPDREALLRSVGVDFEAAQGDKFEAQWQKNFALFKEYIASTGRFPGFKTVYKGARIRDWLNAQKAAYNEGKLLPARESLLRSVGVDFETSRRDKDEAQWQQQYELFKEYASLAGHFPPFEAVYNNVRLGAWFATQKRAFKIGKLSPEREALLRSVGVDFETSQNDKFESQWRQNYELLKEYVAEEGHLPPQKTVYKGVKLGTWFSDQKQDFKNNKLSPEREQLLCSLGVDFEISAHEKLWHQNYELLKEYVSLEGHLPRSAAVYKDHRLGAWILVQKQLYKAGKLFPDREALLRSVGVDFETSQSDKFESQWRQNYELLKEYVFLEGHLPPQKTVCQGINLGDWLTGQKQDFKNNKLSPEREQLLRSLGVDFEVSAYEKLWHQNYELLKEYVSLEGHLPPIAAVYKDCRLGVWLKSQKKLYKAGKLSPERESLLRSLGVEFKLREKEEGNSLEDKIAAAEEYRDEAKKQVPGDGKEKSPRNELGL